MGGEPDQGSALSSQAWALWKGSRPAAMGQARQRSWPLWLLPQQGAPTMEHDGGGPRQGICHVLRTQS